MGPPRRKAVARDVKIRSRRLVVTASHIVTMPLGNHLLAAFAKSRIILVYISVNFAFAALLFQFIYYY